MKKSNLFWFCAALMLAISMSSCSSDDETVMKIAEEGDSGDTKPEDKAFSLEGTWQMVKASYAFQGSEQFDAGDITITFNKNKTLTVVNNRPEHFLKSGTYPYTTTVERKRIYTYKWVEVELKHVVIETPESASGSHKTSYGYSYSDGMLILDGGMESDGPGYFFKQ